MRRRNVIYVPGSQVLSYQWLSAFLGTLLMGSLICNVIQYNRLRALETVEPIYITTEQLALRVLIQELTSE